MMATGKRKLPSFLKARAPPAMIVVPSSHLAKPPGSSPPPGTNPFLSVRVDEDLVESLRGVNCLLHDDHARCYLYKALCNLRQCPFLSAPRSPSRRGTAHDLHARLVAEAMSLISRSMLDKIPLETLSIQKLDQLQRPAAAIQQPPAPPKALRQLKKEASADARVSRLPLTSSDSTGAVLMEDLTLDEEEVKDLTPRNASASSSLLTGSMILTRSRDTIDDHQSFWTPLEVRRQQTATNNIVDTSEAEEENDVESEEEEEEEEYVPKSPPRRAMVRKRPRLPPKHSSPPRPLPTSPPLEPLSRPVIAEWNRKPSSQPNRAATLQAARQAKAEQEAKLRAERIEQDRQERALQLVTTSEALPFDTPRIRNFRAQWTTTHPTLVWYRPTTHKYCSPFTQAPFLLFRIIQIVQDRSTREWFYDLKLELNETHPSFRHQRYASYTFRVSINDQTRLWLPTLAEQAAAETAASQTDDAVDAEVPQHKRFIPGVHHKTPAVLQELLHSTRAPYQERYQAMLNDIRKEMRQGKRPYAYFIMPARRGKDAPILGSLLPNKKKVEELRKSKMSVLHSLAAALSIEREDELIDLMLSTYYLDMLVDVRPRDEVVSVTAKSKYRSATTFATASTASTTVLGRVIAINRLPKYITIELCDLARPTCDQKMDWLELSHRCVPSENVTAVGSYIALDAYVHRPLPPSTVVASDMKRFALIADAIHSEVAWNPLWFKYGPKHLRSVKDGACDTSMPVCTATIRVLFPTLDLKERCRLLFNDEKSSDEMKMRTVAQASQPPAHWHPFALPPFESPFDTTSNKWLSVFSHTPMSWLRVGEVKHVGSLLDPPFADTLSRAEFHRAIRLLAPTVESTSTRKNRLDAYLEALRKATVSSSSSVGIQPMEVDSQDAEPGAAVSPPLAVCSLCSFTHNHADIAIWSATTKRPWLECPFWECQPVEVFDITFDVRLQAFVHDIARPISQWPGSNSMSQPYFFPRSIGTLFDALQVPISKSHLLTPSTGALNPLALLAHTASLAAKQWQARLDSKEAPACAEALARTVQRAGLKVELRDYQLQTLEWMREQESLRTMVEGVTSCALYSAMLVPLSFPNGFAWYNVCSRTFLDNHPPLVFGGMLIQEMGCGKTVVVIALIADDVCRHLRSQDPQNWSKSVLSFKQTDDEDEDDERKTAEKEQPKLPPIHPFFATSIREVDTSSSGVASIPRNALGYIRSRTTLILTPPSLAAQWKNELNFKSDLRVLFYYGSNRTKRALDFLEYDVVVTTLMVFVSECKAARAETKACLANKPWMHNPEVGTKKGVTTCISALAPLLQIEWHRIILDEAHLIAESSQTASDLLQLCSIRKWVVTGSPAKQHIDELRFQMKFLGVAPTFFTTRFFQSLSFASTEPAATSTNENLPASPGASDDEKGVLEDEDNDNGDENERKSAPAVKRSPRKSLKAAAAPSVSLPPVHLPTVIPPAAPYLPTLRASWSESHANRAIFLRWWEQNTMRHVKEAPFAGRSVLLEELPPVTVRVVQVPFASTLQVAAYNLQVAHINLRYHHWKSKGTLAKHRAMLAQSFWPLLALCSFSAKASLSTIRAEMAETARKLREDDPIAAMRLESHQQQQLQPLLTKKQCNDWNDNCAICLTPLLHCDNVVAIQPCKHMYCRECIHQHFRCFGEACAPCPRCRSAYTWREIQVMKKPSEQLVQSILDPPPPPLPLSNPPTASIGGCQDDVFSGDRIPSWRTHLAQPQSTHGTDENHIVMDAKLVAAVALVRDILQTSKDDKVLLFTLHTETFEACREAFECASLPLLHVSSSFDGARRERIFHSFAVNAKDRILLLPIRSAATGLNLQAANHVVFLDACMNTTLVVQGINRVRRMGQLKSTSVTFLSMTGTIEDVLTKRCLDHFASTQENVAAAASSPVQPQPQQEEADEQYLCTFLDTIRPVVFSTVSSPSSHPNHDMQAEHEEEIVIPPSPEQTDDEAEEEEDDASSMPPLERGW